MPKYYEFKIAGYYLYFTSHCVIECMHVHASDRKLTEAGSAKFFVRENGDTVLQNKGILNNREIHIIQGFIKHYVIVCRQYPMYRQALSIAAHCPWPSRRRKFKYPVFYIFKNDLPTVGGRNKCRPGRMIIVGTNPFIYLPDLCDFFI